MELRKIVDGKDRVLATIGKREIFGEMVLINEYKRSSDIISIGQSDILILESSKIFELFENKTKVFSVLIFNIARILVKRLRSTMEPK